MRLRTRKKNLVPICCVKKKEKKKKTVGVRREQEREQDGGNAEYDHVAKNSLKKKRLCEGR